MMMIIIRLNIVIELIVSMWKYYNLFIGVSDEIMVISACNPFFKYTFIGIVIYEFTFNMIRLN